MRQAFGRRSAVRLFCALAAVFLVPSFAPAAELIKIGVLARGEPAAAVASWNPTAEYLSRHVGGYRFAIIPLPFEGVEEMVARGEVDFLILNPQLYVEMELGHRVSRLATMKREIAGREYAQFGGVIFCRADRQDIVTVDGLVGKRFAAVDENSFGGWIAALYEFRKLGVNIGGFFRDISFAGSGEAVVKAVLAGEADAGTVRTGTLEKMAAAGALDLGSLRIINPQMDESFGLLRSTALYPEWAFAKREGIPYELAEQVAVTLMTMPHHHPAALAADNTGWTIPANYHPVFTVLSELKIGAFSGFGAIKFTDVLRTYWRQAIFIGWLLGTLIVIGAYIVTLNRKLGESQRELTAELAERRLAEQKLRNITEMLGEGVYVLDERGCLAFMNPEAEKMLGWKEEDLKGKSMHDAIHHMRPGGEPFPASECPANRTLVSGETYRVAEDFFIRKDGVMFPVAFVSTPLRRDGAVAGSVSIFRDITEEKAIKAALLESKNAAEEATQLKDKFVSLVAHDLKTPFNSIIGYLKMLHKDTDTCMEPRHRAMLEKAMASSENLVYMIEELLDISRLQTGKITIAKTPVDIRTLAAAALEKFSHFAEEKGIAFVNDLPRGTVMAADFQLYSRVLQNLVSNAVKFCRRGDTVRIHLSERMPNTVAVTDTGIGVPADILPDIFKHEEKTTTPGTDGETGTGLGLPFSSDIMKAHGGSLWVESESGKGSTFYVTLPPA